MKATKNSLGQIHLYTGDGKGKTTAALGLALRAAGNNKKVGIIFFDKGGFRYGERKSLLKLTPQINFFVTGKVRFRPGKPFRFSVLPADQKEGLKGLELARALFRKKYDLIILDEVNVAAKLKIIPLSSLLQLIKEKPIKTELVLTGRRAPKALWQVADLITEMKLHKHYFYQGIAARRGIEF